MSARHNAKLQGAQPEETAAADTMTTTASAASSTAATSIRQEGRSQSAQPAGRVISLSEVMVDILMGVNKIPHPGGYAFSETSTTTVGGGFTVLKAAKRMGAAAEHAGIIGNGPWATMIRNAFDAEGIAHTGQDRLDEDSGFRVILGDGGTRKTLIATYGAEAHGSEDAFDTLEANAADVLHISGNSLMNRTAGAVYAFLRREDEHWNDYRYAADDNRDTSGRSRYRLVFDPMGAAIGHVNESLIETLILDRPIWSCNKREARAIAHRLRVPITEPEPITVDGRTDAAMPELCEGLGAVLQAPLIIRTGSTGAWVWEPMAAMENAAGAGAGSLTHVPGFATKALHTQSAGGCHTGALCAELARGASLVDAVRVANAASSLAVARADAGTGAPNCPSREEALALADGLGE